MSLQFLSHFITLLLKEKFCSNLLQMNLIFKSRIRVVLYPEKQNFLQRFAYIKLIADKTNL